MRITSNSSRRSKSKKKRKGRNREVHFCVSFTTKAWGKPVHAILDAVKKKHGIKWFRISMSYSKFSNLRETFQGDLNAKVMQGIESMDFLDKKCNCRTKNEGLCKSGPVSDCRMVCLIYLATCLCCGMMYIGNTQQEAKTRAGQHFGDVKRLVNTGKKSDTFASHFAEHYRELKVKASKGMARAVVKTEVIWKGNIISCMKSLGKRTCKLCMKERIAILDMLEKNPGKMINSRSEVFGGCRHKTRFHRYRNRPIEQLSTDDGGNPERVNLGYNGKFAKWWENTTHTNGIVVCTPCGNSEPADTADV